ncbi:DUF1552 domain-containing protein [Marinagarivorans algicola]|uniref:DUF1552 domain-containing protein n=1 Tax=Marinagarivorans algicola TaxID=1513270 RepID=UPI0037357366
MTQFKTLNRRSLIKALSAAGLLSASSVERALAATEAPLRVLTIVLQHGWGLSGTSNRFMSEDTNGFVFPDGLDPFNSIKEHCTVIDGLLGLGEWGNNHDLSYADILTAGVPFGQQSSSYDQHMPLSVTPSIDYLLQEHSGKAAFRFSAAYRSWGVQYHPLSFDRNSSILPFYTKASDAYNSIYKGLPTLEMPGLGGSDSTETRLLNQVFEFIKNPAQQQYDLIPVSEKDKLDRYLLAVKHLEDKYSVTVGYSGTERLAGIPKLGQSPLDDFSSYLDMVKVGFANNLTTSAVVGVGDIIPLSDFHHVHAHTNSSTYWNTRRTYAQAIVKMVIEMSKVVDFDDNSLLDNTLIVLTGEVGDGRHNVVKKGHILIGGGNHFDVGRLIHVPVVTGSAKDGLRREDINGTLQGNVRWSRSASDRTNADLWREVGIKAGLSLTEFGLPSQNRGDIL